MIKFIRESNLLLLIFSILLMIGSINRINILCHIAWVGLGIITIDNIIFVWWALRK